MQVLIQIGMMLLKGKIIKPLSWNRHMLMWGWECKREKWERIPILLWFDRSEVKKIKGNSALKNVQVFTLTVLPLGKNSSTLSTLPLAITLKNSNHLIHILEGIRSLNEPCDMFWSSENMVHSTIAYLDIISNDPPERFAATSLINSGKFHTGWHHIIEFIDAKAESCPWCISQKIQRIYGGNSDKKINVCTDLTGMGILGDLAKLNWFVDVYANKTMAKQTLPLLRYRLGWQKTVLCHWDCGEKLNSKKR